MKVRILRHFCATVALLLSSIPGLSQQPLQLLHHHVRPAVSSGQAEQVGSMPPAQRLNLSIVLPLRNQSELDSLLGRLYDPSSPDYHHFLGVDQFTLEFGPKVEDYQAVIDFARANGFTVADTPANRMIVPIRGSVAQIERAFHVRMNVYSHPTENRTFYSPDREPSLNLSVPVEHIAGLNNFSLPRPTVTKAAEEQRIANATGSGPGGSYLAGDMRAAYYTGTLPDGVAALTGSGQAVGLVEFDGYNIGDVTSTLGGTATSSANGSNYVLSYTPSAGGENYFIPVNNVLLDGANGAPISGNDAEQILDIAQAIGMAPGLSQVRVYMGSSDVDILNAMATENIARQLSISWTWNPDDPSTDDYFFEEFAAQGQSVFAASGDYGAFDPLQDKFYPGEDAWVTSVGATDLVTTGAGGAWLSETAWEQSGGGISPDGIPIPSWQAGVASSLNGGSVTQRNVPDLAAEGNFDNYDCNMGVCQGGWGGTSFAAPRWAGFMALVNQQAVAASNQTVGFINPAIYTIGEGSSYGTDFHDITIGNNDCCGQGTLFGADPTYNAVPGYDLVTGWGSPTGQDLIDALAQPAAEGFQLSGSPSSLTINSGATGTSIITVRNVGGFAGSVNLSVSGLPSGVTASFGTNPATGSTVLTLTVSSSVIRGSYLVTITGTSGALTASTTLALAVNAPGFTLLSLPGPMNLFPGASTSTTIAVTDYAGFNGSVNLAVTSALPSGVTASWVTNPTSSASLLILTANNSAPDADTVLTITGTSGALSETTSVPLLLQGWNFRINCSPIPSTIVQGGSVTSTFTLVPIGKLTGTVTLTAPQLPPGVTASFSPDTTTGTSVLTMTASSTAPLGTSMVEIGGPVTNSEPTYEVFPQTIIAAPSPTFTVVASPALLTLTPGESGATTVTVQDVAGFTGSVTLSANNWPPGISASFGTNPATGSSVLKVAAGVSAAPGVYYLSIVGTSGAQSTYATIWVVINPPPSFTLSAASASVKLAQGASVTDTIAVLPHTGFTGKVTLSAPNLPSGLTASFSPNPTTGSSVLTLTASSTTTPGSYLAIIAGTSGTQTVTTSLALTVNPPVSFSLGASPAALTLIQGTSGKSTIAVTGLGGGFPGNVSLAVSGLPGGVSASWSANPSTGISILTLAASSSALPGTTTMSITGASGAQTASTTLTLTVGAQPATPAVTVTLSSSNIAIAQQLQATITVSGTTGRPTPTGTVTLTSDSYTSASTTLTGGIATISIPTGSLVAGVDALTANYSGDSNYVSGIATDSVTVIGPSALTIPAPGSALTGSKVTFVWTVANRAARYSLWLGSTGVGSNNLYDSGETTATSVTAKGLPTNGETIYARLYTSVNGAVQHADFTYNAVTPPAITTQPVSQTVAAGSSATFSVETSRVPALTFVWQYLSGATWKPFGAGTGYSTATLTTVATTAAFNGLQFRVVVTDANGLTATSDTATLTIAPVVTTQPTSQTVTDGSMATFSVVAAGVPALSYQWQYLSGKTWKPFGAGTGYSTATLTTVATTAAFNGLQFRVVVTDANGLTATSNTATLTIAPVVTTQPTSQTVTDGSMATFSVVAAGVPTLSYQWQYLSGTTWKPFGAGTGYNTASLTTFATTAVFNGLQFRVVVIDGNGISTASNTVKLTVQ